jgi:hypothetical protein
VKGAPRITVTDLVSYSSAVARTGFPERRTLPLAGLRARCAGAACTEGRVMDKIHIEGLEKTYASKGGRGTALTQVDLTIQQNELMTLVGPSGGCAASRRCSS